MSAIKVTWDIGRFNPEKHFIYRSDAPISPNNLPTPIAEVGQGINEYNDLSIVDGEEYHYFVAAEKMGLLVPADSSVLVPTMSLGPGPQTLLAGNMTDGFFGEVAVTELISGDALAANIGLTAGTSQFSSEPWLKFAIDGKIIFVAKKPYRRNISWSSINQRSAVNGLDISINEWSHKLRLIKGGSQNPALGNTGTDGGSCVDNYGEGSEWNRLIYRVMSAIPSCDGSVGSTSTSSHGGPQVGDNWAEYSEDDLKVGNVGTDVGRYTLCMERMNVNLNRNLRRGQFGFASYGSWDITFSSGDYGWRPVLELQS